MAPKAPRLTCPQRCTSATAVPTPALLPGLLGFALSLVRKHRGLAH
ncbi:MAG: PTPA-CTERM sorting domain-containing protein [Synechococcales cyanobacterium RM1_1_8]|nr:PTPA-CTERM sorting domain-containing protein [Synechococcales cyanobacterium RM1_1_8]